MRNQVQMSHVAKEMLRRFFTPIQVNAYPFASSIRPIKDKRRISDPFLLCQQAKYKLQLHAIPQGNGAPSQPFRGSTTLMPMATR